MVSHLRRMHKKSAKEAVEISKLNRAVKAGVVQKNHPFPCPVQGCNAHAVCVDLHLRNTHELDKNGEEHPGANSSEYVVIYLLYLCSMIDTMTKLHWPDRWRELRRRKMQKRHPRKQKNRFQNNRERHPNQQKFAEKNRRHPRPRHQTKARHQKAHHRTKISRRRPLSTSCWHRQRSHRRKCGQKRTLTPSKG